MRSNLDSLIGDDGNLKQSATLTPREFFDAAKRGLKSASGKSLKLVEPTPNPLPRRYCEPRRRRNCKMHLSKPQHD